MKKKAESARNTHEVGIYITVAGAMDALKLALDASGAHRTHTHRVLQTPEITERRLPDGHLASGAARLATREDRTHQTRRAQDTVSESGACSTPGTIHRTHRGESGAASGALLDLVFQRDFMRLSPNQVPTSRRHK